MEVRAYLADNRIFAYVILPSRDRWEEARDQAKMVAGARWRKGERCWSYPLSVDTCKDMRRAWGKDLRVHPTLSAWYRTALEQRVAQVHRTTATEATLATVPVVAPALAANIGADQRVTASWMANAYRGAGLLCDEVGVGKTRGIVAGLMEAGITGDILVSCPKISVERVWGANFREWCPWPVYTARGTREQRLRAINDFDNDPADTKILVVVAEMLRIKGERVGKGKRKYRHTGYEYPMLFVEKYPWAAVVVDEAHLYLGSTTVVRGNLVGEGIKRLPVQQGDRLRKLAATATPFGGGGRVEGMFGCLHWCWPDEFPSFWQWAEKNFDVQERLVRRREGSLRVKVVGGLRGDMTQERFWDSLGPRVLRRTLDEVADIGDRQELIITCPLTEQQRRQYKGLTEDGEIVGEDGFIATFGVLSELTRARQVANGAIEPTPGPPGKEGTTIRFSGPSGKVDRLMQELRKRRIGKAGPGMKVVVASQFNEFLWLVRDRLVAEGIDFHLMTGSTTDRQRDEMMNAFQASGGPRVFMMNSKAGGVSITLDAADEMHILDRMYPPEAETQLRGRIRRRGRAHDVRYFYYHSEGTVDEKISGEVEAKLREQLRVLDGRRKVRYLRSVIRLQDKE